MFSLVCNRHHGKVLKFSQDVFIPFKKILQKTNHLQEYLEIVAPAVLTSYSAAWRND